MSKYYKAEDVIRAIAKQMRFEAVLDNDDAPTDVEPYITGATAFLIDLPTIEVNEDAISRGNLISDLAGIWEDGYTPNLPRTMLDFQDMLEDINYKIRNAPSVIPKPKEGEWMPRHHQGVDKLICECSNCHTLHVITNYCPNCGAKMKG